MYANFSITTSPYVATSTSRLSATKILREWDYCKVLRRGTEMLYDNDVGIYHDAQPCPSQWLR